jgi:hypothetical protein
MTRVRHRVGSVILVVCTAITAPARATAPPLVEKVVVRAGFGAASEQFGRAGLESTQKTTRLVNCFAANLDHIAVHDRLKRDVKVFTPGGAFNKAIRLRLPGEKADTVKARDIALDGEVLYVLVDEQADGAKTVPSAMRLATFDVGTGACREVRSLDTSRLASGAPTARGADAFLLHPDGTKLWFVDSIRQMSLEVGTGNPAELSTRPVFGWGSEHRVRTDDNASTINLLDAAGQVVRRLPASGVLVTVSESGGAFAVLQSAGGADWTITIYSAEGDVLAAAPRPNRAWKPFKAPIMERKYELVETPAGAELYEMYANADGVRIVRWAK